MKAFRLSTLCLLLILGSLYTSLFAYDGSDAFLHYYAVPDTLKAMYQSVCKSLVLSDAASDTLKNAKNEFDIAIPKLLGGTALTVADGEGAIVLAEQGSAPVTSAGIDYSAVTDEGFIIKSSGGKTYITGKNQVGVLRGAFHFLRLMQTSKSIQNLTIVENPYFSFRVLDHWYNHYSSSYEADRLYGGHRVFKMESFGNLGSAGAERTRVINYCRMAASLGLNGITPDCVNTYQSGSNGNHRCLEEANLKNQKVFADILGTYGLKYYLSVSYASPRIVSPKMSSADAYKNAQVKQWWFDKVDVVRQYIKNFGGFLMKADSEGEEGPRSTYRETQSQGANPIAEALGRYGLVMIWRTFIYDTSDPDFAVNQSKEFADPPQTWNEAVIVRMKDGPRDFQMIEPPHQLLSMSGARLGMEFQITQEYTGQEKHLCWLVPKWKQILDWDIKGAPKWNGAAGTITHQLLRGAGSRTGGVWAISNLSDAPNWTGHFLHQANYYGWGRLAWNPTLSAEEIADEWIQCSVDNGHNYGVKSVLNHMLLTSWEAYTDYTIDHSALMPALGNNDHYTIDFNNMRNINFYTDWFMDFAKNCGGIGVARCNGSGGTVRNDFAKKYYTPALADSFCDLSKCPEDYILFFHHLKWDYKMKGGMTLIQQLQFEHFNGIHRVQKYIKYWKELNAATTVDGAIFSHVSSKLNTQLSDASKWANTFRSQFGACYSTQVACDLNIVTPDADKAVTVEVGANVNLSAALKTQNGTAVAEGTFNWSIVEPGAKATLTATTGKSTVFSASDSGIYTVRLRDSRWPNQFEEEMILVGNWVNAPHTGVITKMAKRESPPLKIIQGPRHFVIGTPIAGKISIVSLQGRVVQSFPTKKAGTIVWKTGAARGLYLLQVKNETQTLRGKFFIQ
ncbi:MAG: T9SS type A sorting domain-containing protein [Chitinispirillaceae bacterium]|nr:T9SS type A sorting domain-containing protein [Chitinispirillaceae bacterium]